jgi:thioesterase domain-containing protein
MAAHYAREIRSVQRDGPYHLAGVSLGGWIAYAVAHELTRQGSKVALLALLDTRATAAVPWPVYARVMAPQFASRMYFHLEQWLKGPKEGRLPYLRQKLNWFQIDLTRARANLPVRPQGEKLADGNRHDFAIDYFDAVAARYQPPKYGGNVTVFAGADAKYFNHAAFWRRFVTGRVHVHSVAGGHGSLISEAHARKFAGIFKLALRQAEADIGYVSSRK